MTTIIKVTYILSNINKAIAFEWITDKFSSEKFQLSFLLLNPGPSELEEYIKIKGASVQRISLQGKRSYPMAFFQLVNYFLKNKPDIIHCHMFDASLLGMIAGKITRIKKRITTRHHATYNWEYNRKGIKYDKWINFFATDIVAISENVRHVLLDAEKVNPDKIHLIHHGFDLAGFKDLDKERLKTIQLKYNPTEKNLVIGVIARWIEWKGIQYIIPAFKKLLQQYPDALLVLANANGPYKKEIETLLSELPENSCRIIPFENDLFALYQMFDVYVHTPINPEIEAFGQTYVEALAAGIPSVFTLSGVAPEFIEHEKNALVVPFCDSMSIYYAIIRLLKNKTLPKKIMANGKADVQGFDLVYMIEKFKKIYG